MVSFATSIAYKQEEAQSQEPSGCNEHPSRTEERYACARDFRHFLNHWYFRNRESNAILTFRNLWPGQERAVEQMRMHRWLYLLKAGKLGFSELECAFDGWRALFGGMNTRVNILSKDKTAAEELLGYVKFGLKHLPDWLGLPVAREETESDTTSEFKLRGGIDDVRRIVSMAATKNAAIDVSAHHTHVDEMARMPFPSETWSAVESTVAPGGTVHIVTRGNGDGNFASELWWKSKDGSGSLHCYFEPWDSRPRYPTKEVPEGADPNEVFYREKQESMLDAQLRWFLPRTEEDALKGSSEGAYIQEPLWLACHEDLPPLMPGDRTPLILGMDAGVTNDLFACVAVSRHPTRHDDPAVRMVKAWRPPPNGQIDFIEVENWVRMVCMGGCVFGHPNSPGRLSSGEVCSLHPTLTYQHRIGPIETCTGEAQPCPMCAAGTRVARFNVVQIAYDAYQLVNMAQNLTRDRIAWCEAFSQGEERMEADANLRLCVIQRRLAHPNDPELNAHIQNANAKINPGEDTKLRIIKRNPGSKIDLAVATSMAVARCLYLVMDNAA